MVSNAAAKKKKNKKSKRNTGYNVFTFVKTSFLETWRVHAAELSLLLETAASCYQEVSH